MIGLFEPMHIAETAINLRVQTESNWGQSMNKCCKTTLGLALAGVLALPIVAQEAQEIEEIIVTAQKRDCLLYTSDAADE